MFKTQLLLLSLLSCFLTTSLAAQLNINIEISGISNTLEDNVRLFLSLEQQKDNALMSEARLRRLHKKAIEEIKNALQPFGYYRPQITSTLTQTSATNWLASYTIDSGPPLLIAEFNLVISDEINNDTEFKVILKKLPLHTGGQFNHLDYEEIKSRLARFAAEQGYFTARFTEHRVDIDLEKYTARVYLNFDAGARYHFGEVSLKQDVLDADFLQRYIPFEKGSPYTLGQLIELQQALNDSDYFQMVEVAPGLPQPENAEIPVEVKLTPRKTNRYTLGLGYGTDSGARAKFGWEVPLVNPNGHKFDSEAKVSELGYSLGAHYRVPILNPRTDQMVYSAGIVNEVTDTTESTIRTVGASLNRSRSKWRESISINYQREDYLIADEQGLSVLLIPGVNWSRIWGEKFIYAIDGLRFDIGLRGASKALVSDTDFFQLQGGLKAITSLGQNDRLISRGNLGSTWTNEFDQLPSSVRFFAGGAQSVRGYSYQSLGPVDEDGNVIGGKYLMIGSIEYEHSFSSKWSVALFYDGGNAIDNLADKLERGAGFGFRWKSPVGPVRFDLASALTEEGQPWRLHINIGPDL